MTSKPSGKGPQAGKAAHGAPSEVNWGDGAGRQPYANQVAEEGEAAGGGDVFSGGDRNELSGRNLEQLEQVKKKP